VKRLSTASKPRSAIVLRMDNIAKGARRCDGGAQETGKS
jgi:hypothetical protein